MSYNMCSQPTENFRLTLQLFSREKGTGLLKYAMSN